MDGGAALVRAGGELFAGGVIDPQGVISHRYPLAEYDRAVRQFKAGIGRKIQFSPGQ